jgi:hypothetical protein
MQLAKDIAASAVTANNIFLIHFLLNAPRWKEGAHHFYYSIYESSIEPPKAVVGSFSANPNTCAA